MSKKRDLQRVTKRKYENRLRKCGLLYTFKVIKGIMNAFKADINKAFKR